MKAHIDADILIYRVGFTTNDVNEHIAQARMLESIMKILGETPNLSEYQVYLTGSNKDNFRYEIYPEYKATRTAPKPVHYNFLRTYLIQQHGARICNGEEADDRIGIEASKDLGNSIIVSIDKDLKQIPCWHWNFVKNEYTQVTPEEAVRTFYLQLLQGDRIDNIPGLSGVGPVKAAKLLAPFSSEIEYYYACAKAYREAFGLETWYNLLVRNGQLLKIRTKENEIWQPPVLDEERSPIEVASNKTVPSSSDEQASKSSSKKKNSNTLSPKPNTPTP